MMSASLFLSSQELDEEDIHAFTNDLCCTINQETPLEAGLVEKPGELGTKGDPVTLGLLALTFLSSGAAVALFNVFKALFERNSSLVFELRGEGGKILKLSAENLSSTQVDKALENVKIFFEDGP